MKKKNLKHNGLRLNKRAISSLESGSVVGGATNSCLIDVDTNCAITVGCTISNACPTNNCPTDTCPTGNCPTLNCPSRFLSCSCPQNGIC